MPQAGSGREHVVTGKAGASVRSWVLLAVLAAAAGIADP
jgi:hypothetical protein